MPYVASLMGQLFIPCGEGWPMNARSDFLHIVFKPFRVALRRNWRLNGTECSVPNLTLKKDLRKHDP